jgi:hypothetical protein
MSGQSYMVRPRGGRLSVVFSLLLAVFVVTSLAGRAQAQGLR